MDRQKVCIFNGFCLTDFEWTKHLLFLNITKPLTNFIKVESSNLRKSSVMSWVNGTQDLTFSYRKIWPDDV